MARGRLGYRNTSVRESEPVMAARWMSAVWFAFDFFCFSLLPELGWACCTVLATTAVSFILSGAEEAPRTRQLGGQCN